MGTRSLRFRHTTDNDLPTQVRTQFKGKAFCQVATINGLGLAELIRLLLQIKQWDELQIINLDSKEQLAGSEGKQGTTRRILPMPAILGSSNLETTQQVFQIMQTPMQIKPM